MNSIRKTIAFGVAGEGRGHASRAIALTESLQDQYKVVIFAPETIRGYLQANLDGIEIIDIPGINFHKENHIIRYRKTIIKNLTNIGRFHPEVKNIARILKEHSIEAMISDFEPYTAVAANMLKLPVLNLNHPAIVLRYFSIKPDALAAKLAARIMMPPGTQDLICSFYGGDIGPIIRKDLKTSKPARGDYFIVYAKEGSVEAINKALLEFPGFNFRIFPDAKQDFNEALINCRGVISAAGHQMLSEALYLEKPVLAFPQKMQFEQRLNAVMLERSGWGMQGDPGKLKESIGRFLAAIDDFPYRFDRHDNFYLNDFTQAAANCIRSFVESNAPEHTKNRTVSIRQA